MNKIAIGRPINGISLNGDEFLLDKNGSTMLFETEEAAKLFILTNTDCPLE